MTVTMNRNGSELTAAIEGRLDTLNSPKLERQLERSYLTLSMWNTYQARG